MKIVLLLRILWTGGAQKIAIQQAKGLEKLGTEVLVVFLRDSTIKGYDDLLRQIHFKIISYAHKSILTPFFSYITSKFDPTRGIESTIDLDLLVKFSLTSHKYKPDYILCHDQFSALSGFLSNLLHGTPYAIMYHEKIYNYQVPIIGKIAALVEKIVLKRAKVVFAVSERVKQNIAETYRIKPVVTFPGISAFNKTRFEEKSNTLIAVAMWDLGRKPEVYIDIIANLTEYNLVMVGNWRISALKKQIQELIELKGLKKRVKLVEDISEDELRYYYSISKFSLRFGFDEKGPGMGVLESLENLVPPIINSELGTADLIGQHKAGLVLTEINSKAIKEFIRDYDNKEAYETLQRRMIGILDSFSWEKHNKVIFDHLKL